MAYIDETGKKGEFQILPTGELELSLIFPRAAVHSVLNGLDKIQCTQLAVRCINLRDPGWGAPIVSIRGLLTTTAKHFYLLQTLQ